MTTTPNLAAVPLTPRRRASRFKIFCFLLLLPALVLAGYFALVLQWNYSSGERAGWVQKFSRKGWLCKTWEGEMAIITMPGTNSETFAFTVWDEAVAKQINAQMGLRVAVHYDQKVGLPTSCFGDTRYYVTAINPVEQIQLGPGVVVPAPSAPPVPSTPPVTTPRP
jgi:hypothetical protein